MFTIYITPRHVEMSTVHKIRILQTMYPQESKEVFIDSLPKHLEEHLRRLETRLFISPTFYTHPETLRIYDAITRPVSTQ